MNRLVFLTTLVTFSDSHDGFFVYIQWLAGRFVDYHRASAESAPTPRP